MRISLLQRKRRGIPAYDSVSLLLCFFFRHWWRHSIVTCPLQMLRSKDFSVLANDTSLRVHFLDVTNSICPSTVTEICITWKLLTNQAQRTWDPQREWYKWHPQCSDEINRLFERSLLFLVFNRKIEKTNVFNVFSVAPHPGTVEFLHSFPPTATTQLDRETDSVCEKQDKGRTC